MSAHAQEHAGNIELPGLRRQSVSRPGRKTATAQSRECDERADESGLRVRIGSQFAGAPAGEGLLVWSPPNSMPRGEVM
eukprot:3288754-Prymnesium_polylepis.2